MNPQVKDSHLHSPLPLVGKSQHSHNNPLELVNELNQRKLRTAR